MTERVDVAGACWKRTRRKRGREEKGEEMNDDRGGVMLAFDH